MHSVVPGERLAQLADLLGRARSSDGPDAVVGVRWHDEHLELFIRRAEPDESLAELLVGFDAPPQWDALGVLARGRAYRLDVGRAAAAPVFVVHLQARSGASCSLVGPTPDRLAPSTEVAEGRFVELCRRALGLRTAPPADSPLRWWAGRWLETLCVEPALELARHEGALVALFPGGEPFGSKRDLDALEEHGRLLEVSCPWPALRHAAAVGALDVPGVAPALAAWLDDGMFSRWALAEAPRPAALLEELRARLTPALAHRLECLLRHWELLEAP